MRTCLSIVLLTITLQIALSVEPGDPLPTHPVKVKVRSSTKPPPNRIDLADPNDDVPPPPSMLVQVPNTTVLTTTTTLEPSTLMENRVIHRSHFEIKLLPSFLTIPETLPEPTISKHNLIRINRWKFEDHSTNEIRYWYEPDGVPMGKGWVFDTVAFLAYSKREPGTKPVYAFHSELYGEWTNTLQLDSLPPLIGAKQWIPDGISFYTYPVPKNSKELQPVWRYWSGLLDNATDGLTQYRTYLVINKHGYEEQRPGWIRDQILFYALPYEL